MKLALFTRQSSGAEAPAESLELVLTELSQYGEPHLWYGHSAYRGTSGWVCMTEMNTVAAGSTFIIRSESFQKSPLDAALECRQRVMEAVAKFRGAA